MSRPKEPAEAVIEQLAGALIAERADSVRAFALVDDWVRAIQLALAAAFHEALSGRNSTRDFSSITRLVDHLAASVEFEYRASIERNTKGAQSVLMPEGDVRESSLIH